MKKLLLFLMLLLAGMANAQIVNIPDAVFKNKLLNASASNSVAKNSSGNAMVIDVNHDNEIQVSEAQAVWELRVAANFSSLEGIASFTNLRFFNCTSNNSYTLDCTSLIHLETLICANSGNLTQINVQGLTNLKTLNCQGCGITELDVQGLTALISLNCMDCNNLTELDLQGLINLEELKCYSCENLITINIQNLSGLKSLDCSMCPNLSQLDLQGLTNLETLGCVLCNFTSLDLSPVQNLKTLFIGNSNLMNLDLAPVANIEFLSIITFNMQSLDLSGFENLKKLYINQTDFADPALVGLESLTIGEKPLLTSIAMNDTKLQSLDLSHCPVLTGFWFYQSAVVPELFVNLKNGISVYNPDNSGFHASGAGNIFVCIDEGEATAFSNIVGNETDNVLMDTYCNFTPDNYNTISGIFKLDNGNDGCDSNDQNISFAKVTINDGTDGGTSLSNIGQYRFYTQEGNFILTPQLENNNWFTITPPQAAINLTSVNNSTITQDFCVTPNGVHQDIEIVVMPLSPVSPGFDAGYKIVYKNKGNQTLSGSITYNYDDSVLDYVSSSLAPSSTGTGVLTWNYTDLLPFQKRDIYITLNPNPETEEPHVHWGDILACTASASPTADDETPGDNSFVLNQLITAAIDPNNAICLEGASVSPEKIGEYLHYNINFENTGNGPATFVVVKQVIDETMFDISTLQLLDSSHDVMVKVTGNMVEYQFDGIGLESEGKGHLLFKIKTLNSLEVNDSVMQKADIYFDYNLPIATNEAVTTFEVLGRNDFVMDNSVTVYPNPSKGIAMISAGSEVKSIQLYDIQGRLLQTAIINDTNTTIDMSSRATGMYFVNVITEKGMKVEKVIKE